MGIHAATAVAQIDTVLAWSGEHNPQRPESLHEILTRVHATVQRLSPSDGEYVSRALEAKKSTGSYEAEIAQVSAVLRALRADYAEGHMQSVEELVHADVFADFLDMGSELQEKGYKDPAAVIAGSVLEEHLRKLAQKNAVDLEREDEQPKKADTLNADLVKAGVYNKLEQKGVTAWLGLRNSAAHGKYDEYDTAQVGGLIASVREFMVRHPA